MRVSDLTCPGCFLPLDECECEKQPAKRRKLGTMVNEEGRKIIHVNHPRREIE